jgi:hypothetical protein
MYRPTSRNLTQHTIAIDLLLLCTYQAALPTSWYLPPSCRWRPSPRRTGWRCDEIWLQTSQRSQIGPLWNSLFPCPPLVSGSFPGFSVDIKITSNKVFITVWVGKKPIPITGRGGLQGSETLRIPHCLDSRLTVNCDILATCSSTYSPVRTSQEAHSVSIKYSYPSNRHWRPIGLWDVKDPTLSKESAHRWR